MISKVDILGYRIKFVFRHRFEKENEDSLFENRYLWNEYRLGLSFKRSKVVSKPKKGPAVMGKGGTHSNSYMFCVDLIVCKFWIDICYRPLTLKYETEEKKK